MSEIIIYRPADGGHVTVRLEGESLWLTQEQIANLFKEPLHNPNTGLLRLQ